jgi:hypothetical protein
MRASNDGKEMALPGEFANRYESRRYAAWLIAWARAAGMSAAVAFSWWW